MMKSEEKFSHRRHREHREKKIKETDRIQKSGARIKTKGTKIFDTD